MEELTQGKRWTHHTATVPVTEEKLAQIRKEIEDQEVIIQGYQQVHHTELCSNQFQKENCLMDATFLLKTVILLSKKWVQFRCEGQTCTAFF